MFCRECGKQLKDGAKFCNECGTAVENKKPEENVIMTSNVQHQNVDTSHKEDDDDWSKMSTFDKVEGIISVIIYIIGAVRLFNSFGFSISSTGLLLSALMFFYCLVLVMSILSIPIWIVDIIIRLLFKIHIEKTPIAKAILSVIAVPVLGVLSYVSMLNPYFGIFVFLILAAYVWLKEKITGKKDE